MFISFGAELAVYWFIVAVVTSSAPETSNSFFRTQVPVFRVELGLPDDPFPDDCSTLSFVFSVNDRLLQVTCYYMFLVWVLVGWWWLGVRSLLF